MTTALDACLSTRRIQHSGAAYVPRMCPRMAARVLLPDGDVACPLPVFHILHCKVDLHCFRSPSSPFLLPLVGVFCFVLLFRHALAFVHRWTRCARPLSPLLS